LPPDVLLRQDFDSLNGWNNQLANETISPLSTAVAHSGRCSAHVNGALEYGPGFAMPLGMLVKTRPKALEISYWCYRINAAGSAATLAVVIDRPTTQKQLLWKGADLSKEFEKDKTWTQVIQRVDLPAEVDIADVLHLYPWRGGATSDVYFDDLQVRTLTE
jgi:hypothetical protein